MTIETGSASADSAEKCIRTTDVWNGQNFIDTFIKEWM